MRWSIGERSSETFISLITENMRQPKSRPAPKKLNRGVMFGEDVIDYLHHLENVWGCSRSHAVNSIVRMHAVDNGMAKPTFEITGNMSTVIEM